MLHCDVCDQDFKSQNSLEKHNVTVKHTTNYEILTLREQNDALTAENQKYVEELEQMDQQLNSKKMEIEDLNQALKNQKEIIIERAESVKALSNKILELEEEIKKIKESYEIDYFSIFSMGGIGLSMLFYFTKQHLV